MTKRILAMTLCLALTLLACACAASNATVSAPESTDNKGESTTDLSTMEQLGTSLPVAQMSSQPAFSDAASKPTEPIIPEERETTLELVREIPVGEDGIPFYLVYDSVPTYAQIVTPYQFLIDSDGTLYGFMDDQVFDVNTHKVFQVGNYDKAGYVSHLLVSNGVVYVMYSKGELSRYSTQGDLLSTHQFTQAGALFAAFDGNVFVHESAPRSFNGEKFDFPFSLKKATDESEHILTVGSATYLHKKNPDILNFRDGVLTLKEHQDKWYTRRDEGRHIIYETIFYQYDDRGNPYSRFKVTETYCPIDFPCRMAVDDAVCEWCSFYTVSVGGNVFENVLQSHFISDPQGVIYALLIYTDGAKLYRINPGYSDVEFADLESMEDPYHTCKNCGGAEGEDPSAFSSLERDPAVRQTSEDEIMHPALTPDEVLFRANAMANFRWTLMEGHLAERTKVKTVDGVDVTYRSEKPKYIAEADVGDQLTGIPYCHGGHNGYDGWSTTDFRYDSFSNRIYEEYSSGQWYTAGNVNHCGYIRRTLGLDCSAFVGSAYDYHGELGVTGVNKYGHEVLTWSELQCMDALVYLSQSGNSNHCMLFYGITPTGLIEIIDCTGAPLPASLKQFGFKEPDHKVEKRLLPEWYFNDYCFRSVFYECEFYNTNEHSYFCPDCNQDAEEGILKNHTISYKYDPTYHWEYCTDGCGYVSARKRAHTIQYGACSVCGYNTNNLPPHESQP